MSVWIDNLTLWLLDYYLAATLLLAVAWLSVVFSATLGPPHAYRLGSFDRLDRSVADDCFAGVAKDWNLDSYHQLAWPIAQSRFLVVKRFLTQELRPTRLLNHFPARMNLLRKLVRLLLQSLLPLLHVKWRWSHLMRVEIGFLRYSHSV